MGNFDFRPFRRQTTALLQAYGQVPKSALVVVPVLLFAVIGTTLMNSSQAATPYVAVQPEAGIVAAPASNVVDSSASGASAVKFTAASTGARTCPPYPAFPDANCTGVPPGVTLTNYTGPLTIRTDGTVIDSKIINGNVQIEADNVVIKRSKINGAVGSWNGPTTNLLLEDVEMDVKNQPYPDGLTGESFTCRRCNIYNGSKGVHAENFTLEDSYVHDIYGNADSHNEPILGYAGKIIMRHNNLVAEWNGATTGGGMSAVIALYTHGTYWPPMDSVLVEKNRITGSAAGYCVYGGNSVDDDPTNIRFIDNVFETNRNGHCGYYGNLTSWLRHATNQWTNNRIYNRATNTFTAYPEPQTTQ